jgi:hypothetical protein
MSKKEQIFLVAVLLSAVFAIIAILGWLAFNSHTTADEPTLAEPTSARDTDSSSVAMAATQTALALLGTAEPSETPAPEALKNWSPATNSDFMPRFIYDSNRWALTDINTLASLQTDCTVRLTGGHPLGRGWSTEESTFEAQSITFMVIVAKYEDVPRFATYSTKNGAVFEINSANDFRACLQAGERILKTISLP